MYTHTHAQVVEKLISIAASRRITLKGTVPPHLANHTEEAHPVVESFVRPHKWKTAFIHHWKKKEHINAVETWVAVLALEWAFSFPIAGHRILIL